MSVPRHRQEQLEGAALVLTGLEEMALQRETIPALLVMTGSPRLRRGNIEVPVSEEQTLSADRRLYRLLEQQHGDTPLLAVQCLDALVGELRTRCCPALRRGLSTNLLTSIRRSPETNATFLPLFFRMLTVG
jgi:hypothetical protein